MAPIWKPGQSGNPSARARPKRVSAARPVSALAMVIARERVVFTDGGADTDGGSQPDAATETATYTRLERLLRVLWTMALDGDLVAIRCLFEYLEGKPARQAPETAKKAAAAPTADDMAVQLRLLPTEDETCEMPGRPARKSERSG